MGRTKQQLESSRDQLRQVVQRIEREIQLIDADIDALGEPVRLDENFLYAEVIPTLKKSNSGMTSAHLRRLFIANGYNIPAGNFRTFLSRYQDRGMLIAEAVRGRSPRWRLSEMALGAAAGEN